jgi:hypothetical protein
MWAPPVAVELEGTNRVVIERPDGSVAEAVIVILDLGLAEDHRLVPDPGCAESSRLAARTPVPTHPNTAALT